MELSRAVDLVANHLTPNARLTVLTGAGVSAASGVPTFRGADGLWKQHRPEQLATPQAFARDPRLVWEVACWTRCAGSPLRWLDETVPLPVIPPRCSYCDGLIRPGVVWFGESIDPGILMRCHEATRCDVFLTVGTSAVVYPAASLVQEALMHGAYTAEINLEATPASSLVDDALHGPAELILAEIDERLGLLHGSASLRGPR